MIFPELLIELLKKQERNKQLWLVWERDENEAINAEYAISVAATTIPDLSNKTAQRRNMVNGGGDGSYVEPSKYAPHLSSDCFRRVRHWQIPIGVVVLWQSHGQQPRYLPSRNSSFLSGP